MGESSSSPCLVRSFSQPSQERIEGDPLRALTTSVSFGRFMSESLAWEKWSSFTHNRYLEEVEKYARPGSVAEKKAYFEAQHKTAAAKKAAALLEQQKAAVDKSSNLNVTNQQNDHSTVNSEMTGTSSYVSFEETQREEGDLNVLSQTIDDSQMEPEFKENGSYEGTEEAQQGEEDHLNVSNPNLDHCTMSFELPENSSYTGIEEVKGDTGDNTSTYGSCPTHEEKNLETAETESSIEQSYQVENEVRPLDKPENVDVEVSEKISQLKEKSAQEENTSTCCSYPTHEENNLVTDGTENSTKQYNTIDNEVKSLNQPEDDEEVIEKIVKLKKRTQPKDAAKAGLSVTSINTKPLSSICRLTNNNESLKFRPRIKPMKALQPEVKTQTTNAAVEGDSVLSMKKTPLPSASRLTNNNELSKLRSRVKPMAALQRQVKRQRKNVDMAGDSVLPTQKKPLSSNSRLTNSNESSKFRYHIKPLKALQPKVTDKCAPTSRKNGKDVIDRKDSIKFSSHKEERKKKLSPILEKIANSRLVRSMAKTSRDGKVQQTPTLASVSGILKRPDETPQQERSKNFRSTNKHGSKASSTVFSPFSLRSAERAAKRREFFQKLEQKLNAKEAEKELPQAKSKEKATSNSRVLKSRAKPNASIHDERETPSNQIKKEKSASSSEVLRSRAKPTASIRHERESSSDHMKKEKATSSEVHTSRGKPNASIHHYKESSSNHMKKEKATSSSKVLASIAEPNASIHYEREPSLDHMKKEKATSSSKVLASIAEPNASIDHEREPSLDHMKKEKGTSSAKVLTSRVKPNASIHHEKESSRNLMKKMPRQTCSQKFSVKPGSEVQDNKPRQVVGENNLHKVKVQSESAKAGDPSESMRENASPNIQVSDSW